MRFIACILKYGVVFRLMFNALIIENDKDRGGDVSKISGQKDKQRMLLDLSKEGKYRKGGW